MNNHVVGISGTHGTGKSFLTSHLEPHLNVDRSQLSRSAQKVLGWDTLSRAEESEENVWELQNAILDAMIQRDAKINEAGVLTIVERTPADLYAYARMWLQRLNIDYTTSEKFASYQQRLIEASDAYLNILIIFPHESIPFVAEPNRADEASREDVSTYIVEFSTKKLRAGLLRTYIFQAGIHDRVKAVLESLNMENPK